MPAAPKLIERYGQGEGHYERPDGSEFHLRWVMEADRSTTNGCDDAGWYWWNVALMDPCCPAYRQVGDWQGPYLNSDAAFRAAAANDPEASDA